MSTHATSRDVKLISCARLRCDDDENNDVEDDDMGMDGLSNSAEVRVVIVVVQATAISGTHTLNLKVTRLFSIIMTHQIH